MSRSTQPSEAKLQGSAGRKTQVLSLAVVPKNGSEREGLFFTFPLYWMEADLPPFNSLADFVQDSEMGNALQEILADPLLEELWCTTQREKSAWVAAWRQEGYVWFAERQHLPGVTDNLGRTVEEALSLKGFSARIASGTGFLFKEGYFQEGRQPSSLAEQGKYVLYHPLTDKFLPHDLSADEGCYLDFPSVHLGQPEPPQTIALDLDDDGLIALSQTRLLALTLAEMKAIAGHFQSETTKALRHSRSLPAWPTDVELEIIAQTWSEHCKHKIFSACISHKDFSNGKEELTEIKSLYKTYIQAPTFELMNRRGDLLSVFEDNSGVVRWNNEWAVCFKVETHNSPSALEPYGGALTGILGVNRDVLGTGLGARPIFNTDVFCFAYPSPDLSDHPKLLPPRTILNGVRRGVEDGGNKSGIPTVNGAIYFHPGYRAKPLVFCGTGGLLPTTVHKKSGFKKHTMIGDTIVMVGGRVGKDGIHGATFSSEALHEGSPVSAVQIGDPFTQKRVLDFIVEARDRGLLTGITDNGAGGLSSSVGEMAQITNGATLELDNIPLKYPGLADYEIVISESQERMTISTRSFAELKRLAERYSVEATAVGTFHSKGYFEVTRQGKPVALLDLAFLHKGVPTLALESQWLPPQTADTSPPPLSSPNLKDTLLSLLACPNISSREAVIRQYDHEVQGASVIKPLMGPLQQAPCDAAVFRPLFEEDAGLVVSNGLCPELSAFDTYLMAICATDEAVRNAVAVGADPSTITLLDNFCWSDPVATPANPEGKYKLAQLVRACQGLAAAVKAYGTPLISGKDSMKNDFADGTLRLSIPPTLLVSAMGRIAQSDAAVSMDFKSCGDLIYILAAGSLGVAGSQWSVIQGFSCPILPGLDLEHSAKLYVRLHEVIERSWVKSCHDLSEGGLAVALAESVIGSGLGADISMSSVRLAAAACAPSTDKCQNDMRMRDDYALFGEGPARLLITVQPELKQEWESLWSGFSLTLLGQVVQSDTLSFKEDNKKVHFQASLAELTAAWKTPLPFD